MAASGNVEVRLPELVLQVVLSFLEVRDVGVASLTSHYWYRVAQATTVWEHFLYRQFAVGYFLPAHQYIPVCLIEAVEAQSDVREYLEKHRLQTFKEMTWDAASGTYLPPSYAMRRSKFPLARFSPSTLEMLTQSKCSCAAHDESDDTTLSLQRISLWRRHKRYFEARQHIAHAFRLPADDPVSTVKLFVGRSAKDLFVMLYTQTYRELPFDELGYMEKAGVVFGSIAFSPILFLYFLPEVVKWSLAPLVETADEIEVLVASYLADASPAVVLETAPATVWSTIRQWYGRLLSVIAAPYVAYRVGPKRAGRVFWRATLPLRKIAIKLLEEFCCLVSTLARRIWRLATFYASVAKKVALRVAQVVRKFVRRAVDITSAIAQRIGRIITSIARKAWAALVHFYRQVVRACLFTRDVIYKLWNMLVVQPSVTAGNWGHKNLVSPVVRSAHALATSVAQLVETFILIPLRRKPSLKDRIVLVVTDGYERTVRPVLHTLMFYVVEGFRNVVIPTTVHILKGLWVGAKWVALIVDELVLGPCADAATFTVDDLLIPLVKGAVRFVSWLWRDNVVPATIATAKAVWRLLVELAFLVKQVSSLFYWHMLRPVAVLVGSVFVLIKNTTRTVLVFLYVHVALNVWRAGKQTGQWFYWNLLRPTAAAIGAGFRVLKACALSVVTSTRNAAVWTFTNVVCPTAALMRRYLLLLRAFFWANIIQPMIFVIRGMVVLLMRIVSYLRSYAVQSVRLGHRLVVLPVQRTFGRIAMRGSHMMWVTVPQTARRTATILRQIYQRIQRRFVHQKQN